MGEQIPNQAMSPQAMNSQPHSPGKLIVPGYLQGRPPGKPHVLMYHNLLFPCEYVPQTQHNYRNRGFPKVIFPSVCLWSWTCLTLLQPWWNHTFVPTGEPCLIITHIRLNSTVNSSFLNSLHWRIHLHTRLAQLAILWVFLVSSCCQASNWSQFQLSLGCH